MDLFNFDTEGFGLSGGKFCAVSAEAAVMCTAAPNNQIAKMMKVILRMKGLNSRQSAMEEPRCSNREPGTDELAFCYDCCWCWGFTFSLADKATCHAQRGDHQSQYKCNLLHAGLLLEGLIEHLSNSASSAKMPQQKT